MMMRKLFISGLAMVVLAATALCFDAGPLLPLVTAQTAVKSDWWVNLGLESVWVMNEGTGTTVADSVGSVTGTGTALAWATIEGVPCASFNGTSTHIDFGNVYNMGVSNKFTYGGWFFFKSTQDAATVFGKGSIALGSAGTYAISVDSGLAFVRSFVSAAIPTALGDVVGNVSNSWCFLTGSVEKLSDGTWRTFCGINDVYGFTRVSGVTTNEFISTKSLDIGRADFGRYFVGYASNCFWGYGDTTTATRVFNSTRATYGK